MGTAMPVAVGRAHVGGGGDRGGRGGRACRRVGREQRKKGVWLERSEEGRGKRTTGENSESCVAK